MARLPDAFIDTLLSRIDIVELVNSRVPLKRQGKEYAACCPFHNERTPSFTVVPDKQFYHCFGCGAHGSAISFLMEYDRLPFLDAVEELARQAGMEVPGEGAHKGGGEDHGPLYELLGQVAAFYQSQLPTNPTATAYLERRGISAQSLAKFQIGYAPDEFTAIIKAFGSGPAALHLLERVGLLSSNDRGKSYDKFRNRIMFPIHDRRGRVIGFGGRALDEDGGPKYLNSPETVLFHKGKELYGLWHARQAPKLERLVVVEGYLDVVSLAQHGLTGAVATLGTATTAHHAETLFRTAQDVAFCFDGDKAGHAAAWRALESVLPAMRDGRQAWFMLLPEGQDPDSIVQASSLGAFEQVIEQAEPLSSYFFRQLSAKANLSTLDGRARLAEKAWPLLEKIPPGVFADLMGKKLADLTGVSNGGPPQASAARRSQRSTALTVQQSLVRTAVALLLHDPTLALRIRPPFRFVRLELPGIPLLVELIGLVHVTPAITTRALLDCFEGREELPSLQHLASVSLGGEESAWADEFDGAIDQLNRKAIKHRLAALNAQQAAGQPLTEEEKQELRELLLENLKP